MASRSPCLSVLSEQLNLTTGRSYSLLFFLFLSHFIVTPTGMGAPFVLQTILDSICKGLIPLLLVLISFRALRKKVSPNWVMLGLVAFGFIAVAIGLV